MADILGLGTTHRQRDKSIARRSVREAVFHKYPQGALQLTGLLSLMDGEATANQYFDWYEHRHSSPTTKLKITAAPYLDPDTHTSLGSPFNVVANTPIEISVTTVTGFRVNDQIQIKDVVYDTNKVGLLHGIITSVDAGNSRFVIRPLNALTGVLNTTSITGVDIMLLGSAYAEGARSGRGSVTYPTELRNYTQIFRTAFSFTSSALMNSLEFDKTGEYRNKSHQSAIRHFTGIEKSFLFGPRTTTTETSYDGEVVSVHTTGGLIWFLQQWDKGNVTNGGAFDYRPGGADLTNASYSTAEDKRYIDLGSTGSITQNDFFELINRVFQKSNGKTSSRLAICGAGVLSAINSLVSSTAVVNRTIKEDDDTFGLAITQIQTVFGTLNFSTHPLFTEDPYYRNAILIVDPHELHYRHLTNRDTVLLKNRHERDSDRRKDEWLTEAGLEVRFPEAHMFIRNVKTITKS